MNKTKDEYVVVLDEQYSDFKTLVVWLVADYGLLLSNYRELQAGGNASN